MGTTGMGTRKVNAPTNGDLPLLVVVDGIAPSLSTIFRLPWGGEQIAIWSWLTPVCRKSTPSLCVRLTVFSWSTKPVSRART